MWSKRMLMGLWILGLITGCLAWPGERKHLKAYPTYDDDYAIPLMAGEQPDEGNQWAMAQEPEFDFNSVLADYYEPSPPRQSIPINTEIEALANLLYDPRNQEDIWGQIIRERPESELEELKGLDKRTGQGSTITTKPTTPKPTAPTRSPAEQLAVKTFKLEPKSGIGSSYHGQKEFPLLRPPVQVKAKEMSPPVIQQRSDKKPSPYDTLRKYLSIEDALKKEAEKRSGSKVSKRSFVADPESLAGQLTKLKITV